VLQLLLERFDSLTLDPDAEQPSFRGLLPCSFHPLHTITRLYVPAASVSKGTR
jgi:hypothetical protein